MPMFPVTFVTIPVHADLSVDEKRKEGELIAYSQGADQQEAEDLARVWLSDISDAARVYTPTDKPRRMIGPVQSNPNPTEPVPSDGATVGIVSIWDFDRRCAHGAWLEAHRVCRQPAESIEKDSPRVVEGQE